jgi:DNA-binding transcriptional regulator YhcF (GntR family)
MSKGYILLARQLLRHPRFKPSGPFTRFEAWCWLIEEAAFAVREVPVMKGHRREIVTLQPGQLTHSIRFLASAWKWSPNRVQRFLSDLAMDGSVTTQADTAQTLITLCNWDKYQRPNREANTQTDTPTDTKKKELKELERMLTRGSMIGGRSIQGR